VEKGIISISISGATALMIYLVVTSFIGSSSYHLVYLALIVVSAILVLIALFTKKAVSGRNLGEILKHLLPKWSDLSIKDKALATFAVLVVLLLIFSGINILSQPRGQSFTEFYLLSEEGNAYDIPHNYTVGIEEEITIGIANHQQREVQYNVEIWLVNSTNIDMAVTVHEMYFIASLNVTLNSIDVDLNDVYQPQFEQVVGLNLTHPGKMVLLFLLYQDTSAPLPEYPLDRTKDYSKTDASSRVLDVVNKQVQYLQLYVEVRAPATILEVDGSTDSSSETRTFVAGVPQDVAVRISNQEGVAMNYTLEVWVVNYTNVDMAVSVKEMYYISSIDIFLPFTDISSGPGTYYELNLTITQNLTGNYSIFFLLYQSPADDLPESPMMVEKNYAFTAASWRIVRCVNNEIQYFQMETVVIPYG